MQVLVGLGAEDEDEEEDSPGDLLDEVEIVM